MQQDGTNPGDEVLQSVLHSRRTRKTLSSGEDVWPVHLEAALLEGLEKYVPDDSRESRMLGRYRGRNQFVSREIFMATGEWRSSKQVGSRIQQLRHCSKDPKVRRLLDPLRQPEPYSHDSTPNVNTSVSPSARDINISLPLPQMYAPLQLSYQLHMNGAESVYIQSNPQQPGSAPFVTFIFLSPIHAVSWFTVYLDGQVVHTEGVTMNGHAAQGRQAQQYQLSAPLVPSCWRKIAESP
ncbi:hypothetical protein GGX14DRAFT_204470, partial [Mycena pura]